MVCFMLWRLRNAILVEKKMPKMISKKVYIFEILKVLVQV